MKTMKSMAFAAVILATAGAGVSRAQDPASGPVLCAMKFTARMYEVGRVCYAKRDRTIVAAIERSLASYIDFVARNMPMPAAEAEQLALTYRSLAYGDDPSLAKKLNAGTCKGLREGAKKAYNATMIEQRPTVDQIRQMTETILKTDRKPVMGNCP